MTPRLRPKLTAEDRALCARLMTAMTCGDKEMLENTLAKVDEADAVTAVMLGLLDHCCWLQEHTGPLLVEPDDGEQDQA